MRDCGGEGMFCELPACYPISWRGYVFVLWVENCTCLLSKTEATSGNDKTLENGHRRKVKGDTHMWLPASGNAISRYLFRWLVTWRFYFTLWNKSLRSKLKFSKKFYFGPGPFDGSSLDPLSFHNTHKEHRTMVNNMWRTLHKKIFSHKKTETGIRASEWDPGTYTINSFFIFTILPVSSNRPVPTLTFHSYHTI